MTALKKKICMLGAFAVGKTSLVHRFVESMFSERYETTVGVRILKKDVEVDGRAVTLVVWDLHGDDEFQEVRTSYLRGAAGYLLVADGTRAGTLRRAHELHERVRREVGELPFQLLVNKRDLSDEWELAEGDVARLASEGWDVVQTSAKTGEGVDEAFHELARRTVEG